MENVVLTKQEAQLVMQALDVAVRQGGLNTSAVLLPVAQKIEQQLTEEENGNTDA